MHLPRLLQEAALLQASSVLVEGQVQREGPLDASRRQFQALAKGPGRARQEGIDLKADAALQRGGWGWALCTYSLAPVTPLPSRPMSERWREGLAMFLCLFISTLLSLSMEI